ncbi:MAG: ATP-binding protein [Candidatus Burarchaeum sp.]|nr:ATP-binding protein [Candidatus Burarchaeum sp.]MDO8339622.1 ATP-binding protein [Candidatus Burarchaeum sp.]
MDEEVLGKWNPWWVYGKVPESQLGKPRPELAGEIGRLIDAKEVIAVSGVRRSGKSTLLYQVVARLISEGVQPKNILYFNFDENIGTAGSNALEEAYREFLRLNNPKGRAYVFFDEIQNVKGWERWMKATYDLKGAGIKFFITGSNSALLSSDLATLLTGRLLQVRVFPLSFAEFLSFNGVQPAAPALQKDEIMHYLSKYLEWGGFPEVVLGADELVNRQRLKEYFDSILFRDIVASRKIRETAKLVELAQYALANVATAFSYSSIARAIGLNMNSVKEYLGFLEQAYLVFQVNYFSYSLKETLGMQKPKKMYAVDCGMRNVIASRFSQDAGRLAENAVLVELKRRGSEAYFWRGRREVDFVVREGRKLTAINVTYSDTIREREVEGLREFAAKHKGAELVLITKGVEKKESGIAFVPLWKWLLQ